MSWLRDVVFTANLTPRIGIRKPIQTPREMVHMAVCGFLVLNPRVFPFALVEPVYPRSSRIMSRSSSSSMSVVVGTSMPHRLTRATPSAKVGHFGDLSRDD